MGLYAGRQEMPWSRPGCNTLPDLPKIYIPNTLTGDEIVRALKLTGKEQMVAEKNEVSVQHEQLKPVLKIFKYKICQPEPCNRFLDAEIPGLSHQRP